MGMRLCSIKSTHRYIRFLGAPAPELTSVRPQSQSNMNASRRKFFSTGVWAPNTSQSK